MKRQTSASRVAPISQGISFFNVVGEKGSSRTSAVTPSTRPMLAMFEPMALPMANSPVLTMQDWMATMISGADVPTAMNVRPMMIFETPRFLAAAAAALTNRSALQMRAQKPPMRVRKGYARARSKTASTGDTAQRSDARGSAPNRRCATTAERPLPCSDVAYTVAQLSCYAR